jgi:hypothetical protein
MADLAAVTRIDITATDSTGPAVESASSQLLKLGATGSAIASQITNAFAAIGVGLSVAGIVEFTTHIVDAAEQLHRMSLVTGSSVEDLSRLSNAAKITGVDFDTFRSMVDKMASNMESLSGTSTKAQKALEFLGVTAKDPATALQEVAQALDRYADSAGKAAVTRDIFGKGGAEMTAALHAMATASNELTATTTAQAEAAAKLAEQIRTLGVHMTTLKDAILSDAVPALNSWIDGVTRAHAAGLGWFDSLITGTTFASRIGPSLAEAQQRLAKLSEEFEADAKTGGNWSIAIQADIDEVTKKISVLQGMQGSAATLNLPAGGDPMFDLRESLKVIPPAVAAAKTALQSLTESLVDQHAKLTMSNDDYQIWQANLKGAKGRLDELIKSNTDLVLRQKDAAEQLKEQSKGLVELEAATKKQNDAAGSYTDSLVKQNEALQLANDTFGMTATQVELYKLALDRAKESAAGNTYNVLLLDQAMKTLNDTADKEGLAKAAADAEKAFKEASKQIDHDLADMFSSMLFKGKSAFDDLKKYAEDLFKKLVLQPLLQPISNSLAGAFGGIVPGGGGGGLGNLFGGLFGSLGGGAGSGIFGSLGASFANLNLAVTAGIDSIGGFAAALGALAPALGLVAGAVGLLSGLFSKGGGPKQGGQAGLDYYTSEVSPANNAIIQATVAAVGTSYQNMLAALGGKGSASFGLGYDTDPKGTAQSRVSSTATVGGQQVYSTRDVNAGRDDATLQAALALEAQRVVLAALKASDLPADIAKLFSSIDVPTASAADIAAIEKTAATYKLINDTLSALPPDIQKHFTDMLDGTQKMAESVLVVVSIIRTFGDAIDGLGPQLSALDPSSLQAFVDALGGAAAATAQFAYLGQNFLTTAQRVAQSTATLNADFTNLGLAIPATHAQFLALLSSFDLTTDAGRAMYASVLALSQLFVTVHGTADQAAQAVTSVTTATTNLGTTATTAAAAVQAAANVFTNISYPGSGFADSVALFESQIATLADQLSNASVGDKLSFQIKLLGQKIAEVQAGIDAGHSVIFGGRDVYADQIVQFQHQSDVLAAKLADYTILSAQYGPAIANQLSALKDWALAQQTALAGNAQALAALSVIVNDKWTAIVNGTQTGVTNTIAAFQKIADYLKSLSVSTLSPLTPLQKLGTAGSAFEADVTKAQAGDATALGNITADADAYLKLARDAYASSQTYTDIFTRVTQELADIAGTTVTGQPHQVVSDPAWPGLAAALPANGEKLASSADVQAQTAAMTDLITALANAGTDDAQLVFRGIISAQTAIVDAVNTGLK